MVAQVRVASADDAAVIAAIYAPYVADTAISFETEPPSPTEMAERIRSTLPDFPFLAFEEDGRILGYAYGGVHRTRAAYRWSVDVSAYVAGGFHGRGIGRALYRELLSLLERQGFHSAYAGIALPNDKSVGLHEAVGFVPIGVYKEVGFKHGAWHDVGWWRRPLAAGPPSTDPVPFSKVAL